MAEEKVTKPATVKEETVSKADFDKLSADYNRLVNAFNKLLREYNDLHLAKLFEEGN